MSFAVFGATMDFCIKQARKKVKPTKGYGIEAKTMTPEEYEQAISEYAAKLFADIKDGKKVAPKISADISQPSAAKEFIDLAKKNNDVRQIADLSTCARQRQSQPKNQAAGDEVSAVATA